MGDLRVSDFKMNAASGARVEKGGPRRRHEPGDVKFHRLASGKIGVTGDPDPYLVAGAIKRSKKRKAEKRRAIGADKASAMRARMRRKLARVEDDD